MNVEVNAIAVLLAGLSSMAVGATWYSEKVFGTMWRKLIKLDEKKMKEEAVVAMGGAFLVSIISAYVLAHVTYLAHSYFQNSFLQDALTTAFWLWLGFSAASLITHGLFEQRRKKLILLNVGNQLATYMVMALIIGLLKP